MKSKIEKLACKIIGDGKLPNKYFVSLNNDYMYFNRETEGFDWISDLKLFEVKGQMIEQVFDSYKEALEKAREFEAGEQGNNTITIEDRLSGEVYSNTVLFTPSNSHRWTEEREDYKYTKEKMEKFGKKFE